MEVLTGTEKEDRKERNEKREEEKGVRLTKEEKEICKKYSAYDDTGHVHCNECPLCAYPGYAECKFNMTAAEWKEFLEWRGNKIDNTAD